MSSGRNEWRLSTMLLFSVMTASALPAHNTSLGWRHDLTTDFAKSIIRLAKAADIAANMNANNEPCNDFYAYACGNWHRSNPAQLFSNVMTDTFELIRKGFNRRVKQLLETDQPDTKVQHKLQRFYQSCLLVHRDDVHYKLALENVYREFGELPVLAGELWDEGNFTWWRTVAQLQYKYGMQVILAVDIMGDVKNNTQQRVYLGPPKYSDSGNSKLLSTIDESQAVKDLQRYLGISGKLAKQTVKELRDLEHKLKESSGTDPEASLQSLLELKAVSTLQTNYATHLDMREFLQLALGDNVPAEIYIFGQSFLERTLTTLKNTSPRTLANYILWQALQEYVVDAPAADMPEWCLGKARRYFAKYTDHAVYAHYRNMHAETAVLEVWEHVRAEFRRQLAGDKLDWITNATRSQAIQKLDRMQLVINAYDDEDFDELFGDAPIDGLNYVGNVQQLLVAERNSTRHKLQHLASSLDVTENLSYTPTYNVLDNQIRVPVSIMQPRYLWDANYPHALKYATLGYLIAHEILHGFDEEGRNFDEHGNLAPWWDAKSRYEFQERRKCFQAQYHAYTYGDKQMPDSPRQSENIADNGGIKLAYAAYQRWLQQQPAETEQLETLHGLQLDNSQLFFVGFAQLWCDDVLSIFKSTLSTIDEHAPGKHRVIGSLSNFQEFSWVFKCPQDAPMDPEYKCSIY